MNSIRSKIIAAFSLVIFLFISLIILVSIFSLNLSNRYKKINDNIIHEQALKDDIWSLIEMSYSSFNSKDYSPYYKKLDNIKNTEDKLDVVFGQEDVDKETKFAYRSLKNSLNTVIESVEKTKFGIENEGEIVGLSESFQETVSNFEFVKQNITNLLILETKNIAKTTQYIEKVQTNLTILISLSISLIVIFIIIFVISFSKKITKPISELSLISEKISNGDLNLSVGNNLINRGDELGKLSNSFKLMINRLKEKIIAFDFSNKELDKKVKELSDKNLDFQNSQRAVINLLEDIEKSKERSDGLAKDLEKFKLAVENVSDHVVITDPEGIVLYGNKAIERITGYSLDEVLGKKAGVLWSKPMPLEYYKNLWTIIKEKRETFIGEIINKRKNGAEYQAYINISPVIDAGGNIIFFVGLERDITKEKEIDRAKTEFVSLASHQLRTPLSTINWYTEMLLAGDAGKINEDQKSYLEEIYTGNKRMVELVNSLLNVSRLELGTFIIEPELSDIVELGDSVVKEVKPLSDKRNQELRFTHSDNLSKILIDQKLLRIIFQNFLSNSIKYTAEGGHIKFDIHPVKYNDYIGGMKINEDSLLISVNDDGYGITKNQQDRIFSKLFRADNIKEKDTEGTGLGLYIIKTIIDNSGGQIWFESEQDKGSTFYVAIPLSGMKKREGSKSLS